MIQKSKLSHFSKFKKEPRNVFSARVLAVVRDIQKGEVMTYGAVAYKAGYPGAARAVGNVMRYCTDTSVPFHRVVAASGKVGGDEGSVRRAAARKRESN